MGLFILSVIVLKGKVDSPEVAVKESIFFSSDVSSGCCQFFLNTKGLVIASLLTKDCSCSIALTFVSGLRDISADSELEVGVFILSVIVLKGKVDSPEVAGRKSIFLSLDASTGWCKFWRNNKEFGVLKLLT